MKMTIPISKNWFGPEEFESVQQPLRDGWVIQGRQVQEFESRFAQVTDSSHSLACSSGTAALHIAVAAMGIEPGDEVIVPGFTWVATANVVELLGGKPVFCDIELDTFNIAANRIPDLIGTRTVGIIPVHLFGWCAEMDTVIELAKQHGLWVVEDAACALGAYYRGTHGGTIGDIGCFSFHPRKLITTGEGGMLTVKDEKTSSLCDSLRNHGASRLQTPVHEGTDPRTNAVEYSLAGFNYRLTDIQAALGVVQLGRLDFLLAERQRTQPPRHRLAQVARSAHACSSRVAKLRGTVCVRGTLIEKRGPAARRAQSIDECSCAIWR